MAIMIPSTPHEFDAASQEGVMFQALEQLPDSYYVFHSFKIVKAENNQIRESETDFVVYNREKGILCLEAKAGAGIQYVNGEWLYSSGRVMSHGGPFRQAASNMYRLRGVINQSAYAPLLDRCKMFYAVWFPGVTNDKLQKLVLPPDAEKTLVLTTEALDDPETFLNRIFSRDCYFNGHTITDTEIQPSESKQLVQSIFCPEFSVFPSASYDTMLKHTIFHRLLREQTNVLNFLEDQKVAVINGAAGTGKTMIAVEKARRNAADGDHVLFLCYNRLLKEYLAANYSDANIEYQTIDGLACKLCNSAQPDYESANEKLNNMFNNGTFPWEHVVVDEGQDFGIAGVEESNILQTLRMIIEMNEGSFYVFYDNLQLIQAKAMPEFILNADCKLTLYRNCRNTQNIAITSLRPISERKPKLFDGAVQGAPARLLYCAATEDSIKQLDALIDDYKADGYKDIVILTAKTELQSILHEKISDGLYRRKYRFSTCRKFKGLEADIIILVDVDAETFTDEQIMLFYVGTSRARICLDIISTLSDADCIHILQGRMNKTSRIRNPKRELASALNASIYSNQ